MAEIRSVLVVGGGIAGLTTALALVRQGIEVEIVEINPAWSVYGVGIIQPSNMLRALGQIGLAERCLALGFGYPGWRIHDAHGGQLAEVPNENVAGPGYPPINGISRPALHTILTEAVRAQSVPVRLGITVADWSDQAECIHARFTDGSTGRYDLIIGADGAHSATRARLLPGTPHPQLTGQSVWRYNFKRPRDLRWGSLYYGTNSKAGLVPLSDELMYLLLVTMEPGNPRMQSDQLHRLLRDRLQEYGGIIAELREQITDPTAVVYRPMEALLVPLPWHRGRVVLIGDAAHVGTPHLAQGAAMAIEDAVLLAELLGRSDDLAHTLERFALRRLPRCKLVMEAGLQLGAWEMAEWNGRRAPDTDHGGLLHRTLAQLMQPI
jgi:2-polyprenyl-6-methoxyphenol hydroxylase-like FAD-dependent oxidoreductase